MRNTKPGGTVVGTKMSAFSTTAMSAKKAKSGKQVPAPTRTTTEQPFKSIK